jgi:4,5-dihydroxyphthalate decarboxylase
VPVNLRIAFRRGPHVEALLDGRVTSDRLSLQFIPVEPISRAFRRAIRDGEFDVTEMALVTLAMAVDAGHPWSGLPIVLTRGFHHGALRTPISSHIRGPQDLLGCKIGVRAFSQTTGVWVRGLLDREYGITPNQMIWVTTEDAHVPGFIDPDYVQRAPSGTTLQHLLSSGQIEAAIGDGRSSFPETRSVIPNPEQAASDWYRRIGVHPVNHIIAFRRELLEQEPSLGLELQRMFEMSRDLWLRNTAVEPGSDLPYGREVHEKSINLGLEFAFEQGLTRIQLRYEDLFAGVEYAATFR